MFAGIDFYAILCFVLPLLEYEMFAHMLLTTTTRMELHCLVKSSILEYSFHFCVPCKYH